MKPGLFGSIGPAIIVASVVLGPGSILIASRVGCDFGYDLMWLLVFAAVLMLVMTTLAARLGTTLDGTLCDDIARRAGRPSAVFVGIVGFLVVTCFQFSNNVAVIAALESLVGEGQRWSIGLLVVLNLGFLGVLFGLKRLYRPVEVMMKVLIGLMMLGFLGNLVLSQPSLHGMLSGLLPRLPEGLAGGFLPAAVNGEVRDQLLPVQALIATTFSVAGAFYQAYLVREKGWRQSDLRLGFVDSMIGISVLAFLTLTIMVTAAAVLHGRVTGSELESAADVAVQLEPLFGQWANLLFSVGLLAGALSSFLVNVMIAGTLLSDGMGLGGRMDQRWPKVFTATALLVGMGVAIAVLASGQSPVQLIIFAQALTVVGNPVLAGVLLWLSTNAQTPRWHQALALMGFVVVLVLALRTGITIYLRVAGS